MGNSKCHDSFGLFDADFYSGKGEDIGRVAWPNRTIYTLYDYRKRHATYRTDRDLLDSHKSFAWIPVWDDHGAYPCSDESGIANI